MSDIWVVLLWLPLAFVVGGMLGYRVGVIHGYDRAEAILEEITTEQYRRLKERGTRHDEAHVHLPAIAERPVPD